MDREGSELCRKTAVIFLLTYWSGIVDETDLCYLGGTPHDLMDVMGFRSMEIDGLYDGEWNEGIPDRKIRCIWNWHTAAVISASWYSHRRRK